MNEQSLTMTASGECTERPAFQTTVIEKVIAVAVWPLAFLYWRLCNQLTPMQEILFGIFSALFLLVGEAFYFRRKRSAESIATLVMVIACIVSVVSPLGTVWEREAVIFFTHLYAVYWVLSRSGRLAEGKTSHMVVWDGITAFFVMPFKNFPLNVRTIASIFQGRKKGAAKRFWITVLAIAVGLVLLIIAVNFLVSADDNYNALLGKLWSFLGIRLEFEFFVELFLTPPLAMYLYGLFGGCFRESEEQVQTRGNLIKRGIAHLHKVPNLVWMILVALLSLFYIAYFVLQGSYFWDAFRLTLPTQFTFSEYARKGFGEMCAIMIVNFIVMWIATRTSEKSNAVVKYECVFLNCESLLFAVIAFLKLYMYIVAYGFTPLRLQSLWLIVVLVIASVCTMVSLFTKKDTTRIWFYLSAGSLAALCLV